MRFTFTLIRRTIWPAAFVLATTGCTVYAPMQPTMPLIREARQIETLVSIQPTGRVEARGAYSPISHVLLTAAGTIGPKLGTRNFLVTQQYEVGAGAYRTLGQRWLLSGIAGYGQAVTTRGYNDVSILWFGSTYNEYHARYDKLFAQIGVAQQVADFNVGFTYRLTQVRFSTLTEARIGPLPLPNMLRHEVMAFTRYGWTTTKSKHWETTGSAGISVSSTPRLNDESDSPTFGLAEYEANRNLLPAFFASVGIVYWPHWK